MLIYCYADILGYRNLLRNNTASEVCSLLNSAFSEMHSVLKNYVKRECVIDTYKRALFDKDDKRWMPSASQEEARAFFNEINEKASNLSIKTYLGFDTIVIYWEDYQYTPYHTKVFSLAVAVVHILLYMKGIMIRGAMGVSNDYYISDNNRFFIVNNMDIAAEIEKVQNWGNILVFGKKLLEQYDYSGVGPLTEDFYARTFLQVDNYEFDNFEFVPFKADNGCNYIDLVREGKTVAGIDDLSIHSDLIAICPVNNFCLSYFGTDFYQRLYDKTAAIIGEGITDHHSELRYWTARFLNNRINSCIGNNAVLSQGEFLGKFANKQWEEIKINPEVSQLLKTRYLSKKMAYFHEQMKALDEKILKTGGIDNSDSQ